MNLMSCHKRTFSFKGVDDVDFISVETPAASYSTKTSFSQMPTVNHSFSLPRFSSTVRFSFSCLYFCLYDSGCLVLSPLSLALSPSLS